MCEVIMARKGHVRVTLIGFDGWHRNIKRGRGVNTVFDRNGNFAMLLEQGYSKMKKKRIVPLDKIPGRYCEEFVELYPPAPVVPVAPVNEVPPAPVPVSKTPDGTPVYCSRCGVTLAPDADFCHKCGSPVQK